MGSCSSGDRNRGLTLHAEGTPTARLCLHTEHDLVAKEAVKLAAPTPTRKMADVEIRQQIDYLFHRFDQNCSGFLEEGEIKKMLAFLEGNSDLRRRVGQKEVNFLLESTHQPAERRITREELFLFIISEADMQI